MACTEQGLPFYNLAAKWISQYSLFKQYMRILNRYWKFTIRFLLKGHLKLDFKSFEYGKANYKNIHEPLRWKSCTVHASLVFRTKLVWWNGPVSENWFCSITFSQNCSEGVSQLVSFAIFNAESESLTSIAYHGNLEEMSGKVLKLRPLKTQIC